MQWFLEGGEMKIKIGQRVKLKYSFTLSREGTVIGIVIQYKVKEDNGSVFLHDEEHLEVVKDG